jgi:hypothetical protein
MKIGDFPSAKVENTQAANAAEHPVVQRNSMAISKNATLLCRLRLKVMANVEDLYRVLECVDDNRVLNMRNYTAAFVYDFQTAIQNTDDIFKNRCVHWL